MAYIVDITDLRTGEYLGPLTRSTAYPEGEPNHYATKEAAERVAAEMNTLGNGLLYEVWEQ